MASEIPDFIKVWSQFAHPLFMWVLFGLFFYALYSGFQSRRIRTARKDVRKTLVKKKFRFKHHTIGSLILVLMVVGTVGGMAVTYINNGKLFVTAHLVVGLIMTSAIAIATALVPYMQKGNNFARITHIGINLVLLGLFGWETVTGMEILSSIIDRM
ncbi:MAG: DUF4079 domain-containing protein [Cyanobacteria bacterium P01_F01_bin.143]